MDSTGSAPSLTAEPIFFEVRLVGKHSSANKDPFTIRVAVGAAAPNKK